MHPRIVVPELMDDPSLDPAEHDRALAGLVRLNRVSGSHRILWPVIEHAALLANEQGRELDVLDVGCGSGDGPLALAIRARKRRFRIRWTLCDINDRALAHVRNRAARCGIDVRTVKGNAWASTLPCEADIVTSSLFLHHCSRQQAERVLRNMKEAARVAVGVTDLDRRRLGKVFAWLGSRTLSRSSVVHFDAVASVRAALTIAEVAQLSHHAGMQGARIDRMWPARWRLWWIRT